MKTGKLVGLLAVLAAGAALGILFAPDKGSVTRKKWSKKGSDLADDLKDKFSDFVDGIAETVDSVDEQVKDVTNKAKNLVDNDLNKFTDAKKTTQTGAHNTYNK